MSKWRKSEIGFIGKYTNLEMRGIVYNCLTHEYRVYARSTIKYKRNRC